MIRRASLLSALAVLSLHPAARAADVYTDVFEFLEDIKPGYYLENFNSVPNGPVTSLNFSGGGFAYTVSAESGPLFNEGGVITTDEATTRLVITFTGAPVTAVGANFYATDQFFAVIPAKLTIELSDGTVNMFTPPSNKIFRGFITNVPISKVTIDADDTGVGPFAWATMDNLYVAVQADGSSPCYPDCDNSGLLDINDFICFQTFFAIGDFYADCDSSSVLDINDFICFQTWFAIGC